MRLPSLLLLLVAASTAGCPEPQALPVSPPVEAKPAPTPAPACKRDIDAASLATLQLEIMGRDVAPGARVPLRVGHYTSPDVPFEPVPACVRWFVAPADMAKVDDDAQTLTVLPHAKGKLQLHGTVTGSSTPVQAELIVIGENVAPLVGTWKEQARLDCGTRSWMVPQHPIRELQIRAAGELLVTWFPFEAYHDYWASFSWDPSSTRMTLQLTGGNYQPLDVQTSGKAWLDGRALILEGIWLGSAKNAAETPACGHRFVR